MTMPAILAARSVYCMVPGRSKAEAVRRTLGGPIETACPASALRRHPDAALFLDEESAERVDTSIAGR
jgi:glucosamine-6-phosphate deaminase